MLFNTLFELIENRSTYERQNFYIQNYQSSVSNVPYRLSHNMFFSNDDRFIWFPELIKYKQNMLGNNW